MTGSSVLFDAPGPRARIRNWVITGITVVILLLVAWVVYSRLNAKGQLTAAKWEPFLTANLWKTYILPGVQGTLIAAAVSIVLAVLLGFVLGVGRLSTRTGIRWLCSVVVEFFRAVPVLLLMIFAYFGIYTRSDIFSAETAPLAAVVTGLTLYNGSVIAELVRSGVFSLPKGQAEAGLSVGLTESQVMRAIQLPQALTAMLPALIGQFVVVLKDSALGYQVTYPELLNSAKTLGSNFTNTIPAYLVAALLFIVINYSLSRLAVYVERRLSRRGRTTLHEATALPAAPGEGVPA